MDSDQDLRSEVEQHLSLIGLNEKGQLDPLNHGKLQLAEQIDTAPLFTLSARAALTAQSKGKCIDDGGGRQILPQYGLLGQQIQDTSDRPNHEMLMYTNVSAPWSAFICGIQGSGKSHTLSCLLENSLISPSPVGKLASPLAGLVLHYDKFTTFSSTQLCESAYLCSRQIPVRILVSPTNFVAMRDAYTGLEGLDSQDQLSIEPMYLPKKGLTIGMMKSLMGINKKDSLPLYMEVSGSNKNTWT